MKKFSKALSCVIALLMCLTAVLVACQTKLTISLDKTEADLLIGDTVTLTATPSKETENVVAWSSSNPDVATVSQAGVVRGISAGTATIRVICGEASATCTVTVKTDGMPDQEGTHMSVADYRSYAIYDLKQVQASIGAVSTEIDAQVEEAMRVGMANVNKAHTIADVQSAFNSAKSAMANCIPLANGVFDFTGVSNAEKTKILGVMEAFAIKAGLTGTTLFENGRYQIYNERVTLGTENYINGYGFGTLAEGNITADLANETNTAWKRYYHGATSENPNSANYLDSQASTVGDMYGYIGASYYTNFMNSTKDGYVWTPELAVSDPEPVGELNAAGQTATWRIELRKGLKYSTLSDMADRAAFNNREVVLEDYITPYKLLLNQGNQYYRGSELSKATGASAIVGAKEYYNSTKGQAKGILSDETVSFAGVGVKTVEENGKWYLQFTLGAPVNLFYARYYTSSSLYMPIPASFIELVGVENYLGFDHDKVTSPVDNSLSLGAYTIETWNEQEIVFKKNPNYVFADTKYAIEGVHIQVITAAKTDKEAVIKEFEAGNLDAAGIPDTYLDKYKNNPRTRQTIGDSCFKLNMNALSAEDWAKLFGVNGSAMQTPEANYWEVEPAMSNAHFRSALSYALNRNEFASSKGYVASVDFFSPNYMSDPENGIYYYTTQEHKNALSSIVDDDTDEFGYSLELARNYFRMAIDELETSGAYTRGTKANPTVITLQVAWQYASDENDLHKYVKQYWEDAFNDDSVTGGCYKLEVEFWVGNTWMDVYTAKMLIGRFDIGFGSISGNTLDPLSFFNVLSSNMTISNNFTLNWAIDTGDPAAGILVYNGMRWSWDALYQATQQPTIVKEGSLSAAVAITDAKVEKKTDAVTVTITVDVAAGVTLNDIDFAIFAGSDDYNEFMLIADAESLKGEPTADGSKRVYTFELTGDWFAEYEAFERDSGNEGFDLYAAYTINSGDVTASADLGYLSSFHCKLFS